MSKIKTITVISLILLPLLLIYYKVEIKKLSMIPKSSSNEWNIELKYNIQDMLGPTESTKVLIPVIESVYNQTVKLKSIKPKNSYKKIELDHKSLISVKKEIKKLSINYQLKLAESFYGQVMKAPNHSFNKKQYLSLNDFDETSLKSLRLLNTKFNFDRQSHLERIRALYLYLTEEFISTDESSSIKDSLELYEASNFVKAQILMAMARINKIPARTMLTYIIEDKDNSYHLKKSYVPEVLINKKWLPVNVNASTFNRIAAKQFIVNRDVSTDFENTTAKALHTAITPVMINQVDSQEYQKKLSIVSGFLSAISLHRLSPTLQNVFLTILLIPIGTLILAIGRNIVGLKTFGIFTPILLSLFFLETSLLIGLLFFSFIVILGFGQRYILDKFYLLAVPRLSILLTLVIISYAFVGILSTQDNSFVYTGALNYFPIVIIAVFIERFSIHFIEEGPWNTFKALIGTLVIAASCYLVFEIYDLKVLLFNHPELLLMVIAFNIMIGSYKGYRLSELIRFKEFRRL